MCRDDLNVILRVSHFAYVCFAFAKRFWKIPVDLVGLWSPQSGGVLIKLTKPYVPVSLNHFIPLAVSEFWESCGSLAVQKCPIKNSKPVSDILKKTAKIYL